MSKTTIRDTRTVTHDHAAAGDFELCTFCDRSKSHGTTNCHRSLRYVVHVSGAVLTTTHVLHSSELLGKSTTDAMTVDGSTVKVRSWEFFPVTNLVIWGNLTTWVHDVVAPILNSI